MNGDGYNEIVAVVTRDSNSERDRVHLSASKNYRCC